MRDEDATFHISFGCRWRTQKSGTWHVVLNGRDTNITLLGSCPDDSDDDQMLRVAFDGGPVMQRVL